MMKRRTQPVLSGKAIEASSSLVIVKTFENTSRGNAVETEANAQSLVGCVVVASTTDFMLDSEIQELSLLIFLTVPTWKHLHSTLLRQ